MSDTLWHIPDPDTQPEFYADVPMKRLLAWVVDTLLIALASVLVLPFTAFAGIFFFPALMLCVGLVYRTATLASGSATWGMRLLAIEFRTLSGAPLSGQTAFLHSLGYTVSTTMFPLQLASIIMMLIRPLGQGLTDTVLGTVALNRRAAY